MKIQITFIFFFIFFLSNAQNQTNHWLFGNNAYLEFKNLGVENRIESNLTAKNGTSSISDINGNLLFYTNGSEVWGKNHGRMRTPNSGPGVLPTLDSDPENTQGCIITPIPKSPNKYYIFTINKNQDLLYSIVDMELNNGFGQIIEMNSFLKSNVAGRISAVHHENGEEIWLAVNTREAKDSRSYDFFYTFLISDSGIIEKEIFEDKFLTILDNKGQMKFSPNGKKLAFTSSTGAIVFDFDSKTGKIGDYKRVVLASLQDLPGQITKPYGVAFSNDSRFLYFDSESPTGGSRLAQWDVLKDRNAQTFFIPRSKLPGSLQLGRDGKIYNAVYNNQSSSGGTTSLSVINNPIGSDENEIELKENEVSVDPNTVRMGLPNFVQSFFRTRIATNFGCVNKPTTMFVDSYSKNITSVIWDFGDGNVSSIISPSHIYRSTGTFTVKATVTIDGNIVNLIKNIEIYNSPPLISNQKLIECDNDNDGKSIFNLSNIIQKVFTPNGDEIISFYESLNDAENGENEIRLFSSYENKQPFQQEVFIRVNSKKGCYTITSFFLETIYVEIDNIEDEFVCENSDNISNDKNGSLQINYISDKLKTKFGFGNNVTLKFYPTLFDLENDTNFFENSIVSQSTQIWVKAQQDGACSGIGKFNLIVNSTPPIGLENSYIICHDPSIKPPVILSASSNNERFEWRDASNNILSTNQNFTLTTVGEFSLTVYKTENGIECSNSKTFTVVNPEIPIFLNATPNTEDETNNTISVSISGNSNYEFSLDNINFFGNGTSYTFSNVEAGLQTVYVRDVNNCEQPIQTNVSVIGFKKYFTPNGDGENDFWNIKGLDPANFKSINVSIFDRFGKIIFTIKDLNSIGWDGNYNGKPLNENNYWFKAEIVDKDDNIINEAGNFSLIRN